MKKFFKDNYKFLIGLGLVSILFPIIVLTPSDIGFIPRDIGIALVGYFGALVGGFLTFYGVWWTIQNQKEEKKEELAVQYKPVITYSGFDDALEGIFYYDLYIGRHNSLKNEGQIPEYIKLNMDDQGKKINLVLENIGRGILMDGKIKYISFDNSDDFMDYFSKNIKSDEPIHIVPNQKIAISIHMPQYLPLKIKLQNEKILKSKLDLIIKYTDEYSKFYYFYRLILHLEIDIRKSDINEEDENFVIIRPTYRLVQLEAQFLPQL